MTLTIESDTICDERRAMVAGFSNYMMNKPRSAEVERLKTFFHKYEKNTFCVNDARVCLACCAAGASRRYVD
jgi:hypothetical protein